MKLSKLTKSISIVLIALVSVAIFSPLSQAQTNQIEGYDCYQSAQSVSEILNIGNSLNDQVISEATNSVERAKITQSPDDIETAITLISAMPEGANKYDLYTRLYSGLVKYSLSIN
jgi:beta-mannanase